MLLSLLQLTSRLRILISSTPGDEQCCYARVLLFEIFLSVTSVVTTKLKETQGRVMAGVTEQDGSQFIFLVGHPKNWYRVVDGAIRIRSVDRFFFGRTAAIHRETGSAVSVTELRRCEVGKGIAD